MVYNTSTTAPAATAQTLLFSPASAADIQTADIQTEWEAYGCSNEVFTKFFPVLNAFNNHHLPLSLNLQDLNALAAISEHNFEAFIVNIISEDSGRNKIAFLTELSRIRDNIKLLTRETARSSSAASADAHAVASSSSAASADAHAVASSSSAASAVRSARLAALQEMLKNKFILSQFTRDRLFPSFSTEELNYLTANRIDYYHLSAFADISRMGDYPHDHFEVFLVNIFNKNPQDRLAFLTELSRIKSEIKRLTKCCFPAVAHSVDGGGGGSSSAAAASATARPRQ